jgi:4-hydroxy-2-oxoheptanedioate aldolase
MAEINGWMAVPNAFANTLFARGGWDSVTLDGQHGLFDEAAIVATLLALGAASPRRLVRVPWNEPGVIGKVLDAGADGVIAPMINSAAAAEKLAAACWYPPAGSRSYGPMIAALRSGGVPHMDAAKKIEVLAMIETREALEAVREIVAVPGITGLYVGPNDLALSLGLGAGSDREEPEMMAAFAAILAAAAGAGKTAGIYCASAAYARRMAGLGFTMVTAGSDAALLGGAAAVVTACKAG